MNDKPPSSIFLRRCLLRDTRFVVRTTSSKVRITLILTLESVDEMLKCDHSNESYRVVLSCGAVYYAVQGDSNF